MFNKSILAAALLSVGALTAGSGASAAEIGVRNTWGTTTRDITRGTSEYVRTVTGEYSEDSAGFGLGIVADDFDISTSTESYSFADSYTDVEGTFDGTATGSVVIESDGGEQNWAVGGVAPVDLEVGGTFEGESNTFAFSDTRTEDGLEIDGSLAVSGSYYTRHESGDIKERLSESYSFSGHSTTSFSELSTFSR